MNIIFNYLYSGLKAILFFIDNIVYSFIPILYRLLLYLSSIDLVSDNIPVQALIQRIYILVGVFMLFRLSFSIMNYIINPDAFSDQSKGFTNLVKRVLIALVLLVSIPWLFSKAYEIQATILNSNILPRLVLGEASVDSNTNHDENTLEKTIDTSAKDLQFLMFSPFFSLNYASSVDDNGDPSGDLAICQPTSSAPATHILGTKDMAANEECLNKVAELMDDDPDIAASGTTLRRFFRFKDSASDKILDYRKFSSFGSLIQWSLSDGQPAINYYPIVSTLCGAYLVFLLLSFCIDVAARIIRLLFLQILSPIAVISSIDPTSSGDRLKEWGKECLKVFLSLFLRLLVIFLIIQLVRVISNTIYSNGFNVEGFSNSGGINVWIYVFLIFGVFQAAKNVPDLIEKATGIKMSGELQMNPFKALGENTGFTALTSLGIAGATTLGANAWGAYKRFRGLNTKLGEKGAALSDIDNEIAANHQNHHNFLLNNTGALRNAFNFEASAKARETKAWNDYLQNPNSSVLYNRLENARKASIAATQARKDAQSSFESENKTYQARNEELARKRSEAQEDYDNQQKFMRNQVASSVVGIATGAVAGAIRGANGGRKAGSVSGAVSEGNRARMRTTEKRNERDSFADMRHEGTYTTKQRVEGMIDQFAGVMGDKSYGAGQASDLLKSLSNEISRIEHQRRRQDEMITERRPDPYSLSDSNLKRLVESIDKSSDFTKRKELVQQTRSMLESLGNAHADYSTVSAYIDAVSQSDALTDRLVDLYKQRSKLEDIKNIPSNPPGPGKP